jgi:uncharacterized membrane protein YdjX (TVP38/TMEM64 family)
MRGPVRLLALMLLGSLCTVCGVRSHISLARGRVARGVSVMRVRRSQHREAAAPEVDRSIRSRWSEWIDSQPPPPSPAPLSQPEGGALDAADGAVAFGALASTALISEAIQVVGTGALIYAAKQFSGADDYAGAVAFLAEFFQGLGPIGYALYAAMQIFLQVVPVASAFVLTLSAGVVFGSTAKATALVSLASTSSAAISFVIARYVLRDRLLELARDNKTVLTLDRALSKADESTSFFVITLLRSSPLLPFSWASYLFGAPRMPTGAPSARAIGRGELALLAPARRLADRRLADHVPRMPPPFVRSLPLQVSRQSPSPRTSWARGWALCPRSLPTCRSAS